MEQIVIYKDKSRSFHGAWVLMLVSVQPNRDSSGLDDSSRHCVLESSVLCDTGVRSTNFSHRNSQLVSKFNPFGKAGAYFAMQNPCVVNDNEGMKYAQHGQE
jgi:hypothetical protein